MKQKNKQVSSVEQEEIALSAWSEYIGKIVEVTDSKITIEVANHFLIPISADLRSKWKRLLQKGKHVALLALDDGSIRIRSVSAC